MCAGRKVEMLDDDDDDEGCDSNPEVSKVKITLWRRDLLTGVVELDEDLVVRRASPLTGLITGFPTTAMLRKPLSRWGRVGPWIGKWIDARAGCSLQVSGAEAAAIVMYLGVVRWRKHASGQRRHRLDGMRKAGCTMVDSIGKSVTKRTPPLID